jgi:hypothetical protein
MSRIAEPAHRSSIVRASLGIAFAIALAGPAIAQSPNPPSGLACVEASKAKLTYLRPGTDLSKYKTIQLLPLSVPASARNGTPPGVDPILGETYVLGNQQVTALQSAYKQQMQTVLGNAGFKFVDAPQADTLIVAARITHIRLNAPIPSSRYYGNDTTETHGAGAMTIAATFGDGSTNKVIAEATDKEYSAGMLALNNQVTNLAAANDAFATWAGDLRGWLTQK